MLVPALAQTPLQESSQERTAKLESLSKALRWNDEASRLRYHSVSHDLTRQVTAEIDGFIVDNFKPAVKPGEVNAALKKLLADFASPGAGANTVFSVDLPSGHFLLAVIDLLRVAGAQYDDAISLRAYKEEGEHLAPLADAGGDLDRRMLTSVLLLSRSPLSNESRLLVTVRWSSIGSPYSLQSRLYAFDGNRFRSLWKSPEFRTSDLSTVVRETPSGFTINSLSEATGNVIDDQFIQTAEGAERIAHIVNGQ
jgi:hypothetical protein